MLIALLMVCLCGDRSGSDVLTCKQETIIDDSSIIANV